MGRAREVAEVVESLARTRLLTLTGAGGCGKSRLALRAAFEIVETFPDGAWWVELAPVSDPAMVAPTLAQIFAVRPLPRLTELDAVVAYLASRRALVLLDNCEHVLGEAARVADALARGCPNVRILSTSREALRIDGETEWRVPSLSLPTSEDAAGDSDAVRLFVERASQVRPDFSLTTRNVSSVVRLCRDLDGIPLAIELAAARLRVLSVEQVAEGLSDRFRLLTGGARTALERHQTLRASVDWSHELLSDAEQTLFRRLGVFVGGFTLEAVERVCAGEGIKPLEVLELLGALVEKSLVQAEEQSGVVRYRLLETMRQYALDRLEDADEEDPLRDGHRNFFVDLGERISPDLLTPRQPESLGRLDPEAANFASAVEWAATTDPDRALRLCVALTWWYRLRGRFAQGLVDFSRALAMAGTEPSEFRARALFGRAYLLTYSGAFEAGFPAAQEAVAEAERAGDDGALASALFVVGALMMYVDPAAARVPLERGREAAARDGADIWCLAITQMIAYTHVHQDDFAHAIPLLEEAFPIAKRIGYQESIAWHWSGVAGAAWVAGDLQAAREAAERALSAACLIDDVVTEATSSYALALFDIDAGRPEAALSRLAAVRDRASARGSGFTLPWLELVMGLAHASAGRLSDALAGFDRAIELSGVGIGHALSWAHVARAEALRVLGEAREAEAAARRGLEEGERIDNSLRGAQARLVLGRLAAGRGAWTQAQRLHHEALSTIVEHGYRRELPGALEALAEVACGLESHAEAARLLGSARRARSEFGLLAGQSQRIEVAALEGRLRDLLGQESFGSAIAEGDAMGLDEAVAYVRRARGERKRPSAGWESLTPTELDVIRHAATGLTNREIAERMFVSPGTIKIHLSHIYGKLGVKNRSELVAEASVRSGRPSVDHSG